MTDHFIQLYCTNCGGALQVYDDMDRFACAGCGAGMAVERRGGTVVLKIVTQGVNEPQPATDSLRRLQEEAQNLSTRRQAMLAGMAEQKRVGFLIGAALAIVGFLMLRVGFSYFLGLCALMAGFGTVIFLHKKDKHVATVARDIETKVEMLNGRIEDRRQFR